MKSYITIIISVAALAVGFLAGKFQASSSWAQVYAHDVYQRAAGDAYLYASLLGSLRGGHEAEGMSRLEQSLDLSLINLDHLPVKQRTESVRVAIGQVRAYRAKYPWQGTSPQIDEIVQRVLASVK